MKMLREWDELPDFMRTEEVRPYYVILKKKNKSLIAKRAFDLLAAVIGLTILGPIMIVIAVLIARDSKGGVFFRQERITQYGRKFRVHKFRTMVADAEKLGSQVTVSNDMRVTKIGAVLRKYRLDELPQLLDILSGDSGIIGTTKKNLDFTRVSLA
ncbi:sugar transferase [Blautia caccae]|uniref:Sugar transferase n=1 Tax=Blautia caccae TaxID=3133175 RepID=A0ABV1DRE6_9FIRM